ncbi:hypothetical protein [Facilibium subflavum]|uniref:hypothetical protein n=1 Tax=Facilibium subflavum TaxID=2219058 RepID=UPI000E654F54|nr:hypothetical protein [Facilibium subflavum]
MPKKTKIIEASNPYHQLKLLAEKLKKTTTNQDKKSRFSSLIEKTMELEKIEMMGIESNEDTGVLLQSILEVALDHDFFAFLQSQTKTGQEALKLLNEKESFIFIGMCNETLQLDAACLKEIICKTLNIDSETALSYQNLQDFTALYTKKQYDNNTVIQPTT